MPRRSRVEDTMPRIRDGRIVDELVSKLRSEETDYQPIFDEETFPATGLHRVHVIWDRWDAVPMSERSAIVIRAYREADVATIDPSRITLATGLTVPEAWSCGMLPFRLLPVLRPGDTITEVECHQAMVDVGASVLSFLGEPFLAFSTRAEAESFRGVLVERLPSSNPVWFIYESEGRAAEWFEG